MDEPTQNPKQPSDLQATVDATLGTETTATPLTGATALPPTPPPLPTQTSAEPTTLSPLPPLPEPPEPPATPPKKMQEDMPLAFAAQSVPSTAAVVPPPSVPPSAETPSQPSPATQSKKPRKVGKLMLAILGILSLFGAIGGGWYLYQHAQETREVARIAAIKNEADCTGCSKDVDGGWLVWRNGQCKVTGVCNSSKGDKKNTDDPKPETPDEKAAPAGCNKANGDECCEGGYTYCGGNINKCVSGAALAKAGGGCNKYGEVVYGIPTVYGANFTEGACNNDEINKQGMQTCMCGTTSLCFDKTGICDQGQAVEEKLDGTDYNKQGLCAVAGKFDGTGADAKFTLKTNDFQYSCTDNSCTTSDAKCITMRYTCRGSSGPCTDAPYVKNFDKKTDPVQGTTGFEGKCGTVEQLDVMCDGKYITSRTRINPPCDKPDKPEPTPTPTPSPSPSPSPSVSPTMACVGISKNKPDDQIAVGTVLTFTCNGTSTPLGSVALSYQFQVSKDGGAWQSLSTSGATASYTVPGYGDYDVRCRACGEINNANVCDPKWQGASSI